MKLSRILFKPKWQDRDAALRAAAVASDPGAELIAALPELTRTDPDARVRLAALKRLGDYERWRERSTGDADPDVRRTARTAYIGLLCTGSANSPILSRQIAELETLTPAEIETVATTARSRDLRIAALAFVTRPALLIDRTIADPDASLRLIALARIDDPAALERIAERARKSDKTVSRAAREKRESLRIDAGNPAAISARALALCERIEALLREPPSDQQARLADIEKEWRRLGDAVATDLSTRFRGSAALLARMASERTAPIVEHPIEEPVREAAGLEPSTSTPESENAGVATPGGEADPAPVRRDTLSATATSEHAADSHARRLSEQRQALVLQIEQLIPAYQEKVAAGDTAAAQALDAQLASLCTAAGKVPAAVEHRLAPLHARFAELRRWQHWSNQRRRRALCDEIEKLSSAGVHPDAIANRVREAREEWQRLEGMESADAPAAEASGLARRFHGVCQRALKPAHAYFEKRDAVREAHRAELESLLTRASALSGEAGDWKTRAQMRRELAVALRSSLDGLNPRDRSVFAKRLKIGIAAISQLVEAHQQEVEAAKRKLIERASALAERPDRESPRSARQLQQEWTALGEGARSADQRQWREFRAACDRVFSGLDNERKERELQAAAQLDQARALLAEVEALANAATPGSDASAAARHGLEARWREVAAPDRDLERRFRQALTALAAREAGHARSARLASYTTALEKYTLLHAIERRGRSAPENVTQWGDGPPLAAEFSAALDARHERACSGGILPADGEAIERARDILVQMEFTAGIASPAQDRKRRMNYQVSRLSARMRGGAVAGPDRELTSLLVSWFGLPGPLPDELEKRFLDAAGAVVATLP